MLSMKQDNYKKLMFVFLREWVHSIPLSSVGVAREVIRTWMSKFPRLELTDEQMRAKDALKTEQELKTEATGAAEAPKHWIQRHHCCFTILGSRG